MESNTSGESFPNTIPIVSCENNNCKEEETLLSKSVDSNNEDTSFLESGLENNLLNSKTSNYAEFPGFHSDASTDREDKQRVQVDLDSDYWRELQQFGFPSSFLVDTQYLQLCRHVGTESSTIQNTIESWEFSERKDDTAKRKSSRVSKFPEFPMIPSMDSVRDYSALPPPPPPPPLMPSSSQSQEYVEYDFSKNNSFFANDAHPLWEYSESSSTHVKSFPFGTNSNCSVKDNDTFGFGEEDKQSSGTNVEDKPRYRNVVLNDKASVERHLTPVGPRIPVEDILLQEHRKSDSIRDNFRQIDRLEQDSYCNYTDKSCSAELSLNGSKTLKKRLVWTPELHDRFLKAVNAVGVNNAVPKTILYLMNVEGLTSEHVKSHLQKYRNNLKKAAKRQRETGQFHFLSEQPFQNLYSNVREEDAPSENRVLYDNSIRSSSSQMPESNISRDEAGSNAMIDNIMELDLQIQSIVHLLVTARHRVAELSMSLEQWLPHYSSSSDWVRVLKEQTSLFQQNEMQLLQIQRDFEKQQRELKTLEKWNLPGTEQGNS